MPPAPNIPEGDERQLFEALLRVEGGRANNGTLQELLGWESAKYWEARNRLLDMGLVGKVRGGPGGTTFIIDQPIAQIVGVEAADITLAPLQQDPYPDEASLYGPLMEQIEPNWRPQQQPVSTSIYRLVTAI